MTSKSFLIIGASGLVGQELISILIERGIDSTRIIPTASKSSAGKVIEIRERAFVLRETECNLFENSPLVFQCATNEVAREWVPIALEAGCQVIDCSSVFRLDAEVPLVIPSVNGTELLSNPQLIACPNCTTIILFTAIQQLLSTFEVTSINVSTYQALSGAGRKGIEALHRESNSQLQSTDSFFPEPCAHNVFCHESTVNQDTGCNGEEEKVIAEVHKISGDLTLDVIPTCMRVPVERVHTEAITLHIHEPTSKKNVVKLLEHTQGVIVLDDEGHFPTALKASGGDDVLVGHIRVTENSISLVACGDQIRTGAALNAVRIADKLNEVIAQ